MKKKNARMIIDISMTILLPLLMAYSLIGETFHEAAGTLMMGLFIAHHILNRGWYKALFRGRYTPARIFQTVLDLALFVFMILQPMSGILMSKHLYTFIDLPGAAYPARTIHLLLAYWGFVLMSLHAGTHLSLPLGRLKKRSKNRWKAAVGVWGALSVYGAYAFIKRQLASYMFLRNAFVFFDYSEKRIFFLMDYAAIMLLFMFLGYVINRQRGV